MFSASSPLGLSGRRRVSHIHLLVVIMVLPLLLFLVVSSSSASNNEPNPGPLLRPPDPGQKRQEEEEAVITLAGKAEGGITGNERKKRTRTKRDLEDHLSSLASPGSSSSSSSSSATGRLMVDLARSLSVSLRRSLQGQRRLREEVAANISSLSSSVTALGRDLSDCCGESGGGGGTGEGGLHERVSLLESRREEDEAVWVFNTAVCNASVEVLRAEVEELRSRIAGGGHRGQSSAALLSTATATTTARTTTTTTTAAPKEEPEMVLAEVGGSTVLECELEKIPAETSLVWKRRVAESSYFELLFIGDFLFSPELDGRSSVSTSWLPSGRGRSSLSLDELRQSDSGEYLCRGPGEGDGGGGGGGRGILLVVGDNATLASMTSTTTTSTTTTTVQPPPPPSKNLTEARPSSYDNSTSQSWRLERLEEDLEVARAQIKRLNETLASAASAEDGAGSDSDSSPPTSGLPLLVLSRVEELELRVERLETEKEEEEESREGGGPPNEEEEEGRGESTTEELESMRSAVTELRRARSEAEERARVLEERMSALETLFFDADLLRENKEEEGDKGFIPPEVIFRLEEQIDQLRSRVGMLEPIGGWELAQWQHRQQDHQRRQQQKADCVARRDPSSSPQPLPGQDQWCRENCARSIASCPENLCQCPPESSTEQQQPTPAPK